MRDVSDLSHLDARGRARMVDVGEKDETDRRAVAEALVTMAPETLAVIEDEAVPKGDVVAAARLAGVMAAKRTHELIPLCHPLALTFVGVEIESDERLPGLRIVGRGAAARAHGGRDGGARGGVGRGAHGVRHVQGDRPRHGGRAGPPAREERRPQRPLAAEPGG